MNRLSLLKIFILMSIAHAVVFGQEAARDEELLIRGLLRDGLYSVAADTITPFVEKHPDYPANRQLLHQVAVELYKKQDFSRLFKVSAKYLEIYNAQGRQGSEMQFYVAASAVKEGLVRQNLSSIRAGMSDTSLSRDRRLLLVRGYMAHLAEEYNLEEAIKLRNRNRFIERDDGCNLIYARMVWNSGNRDSAMEIVSNLTDSRQGSISAKASLQQARWLTYLGQKNAVLKALGKVKEDDFDNSHSSNEYRELLRELYIATEQWGAAFELSVDHIQQPTESEILKTTFKALDEAGQLAYMVESAFLVEDDPAKKLETGRELLYYYQQNNDAESQLRIMGELLPLVPKQERVTLYLAQASLVDDHQIKKDLLRKARESTDYPEIEISILRKLADITADDFDSSEYKNIIEEIVSREIPATLRDEYLFKKAVLTIKEGELFKGEHILHSLYKKSLPPRLKTKVVNALLQTRYSTGDIDGVVRLAQELTESLFNSLSIKTLKAVFSSASVNKHDQLVVTIGEKLYLQNELAPQQVIYWAIVTAKKGLRFSRHLLVKLIEDGDMAIAEQSARTLAQLYISSASFDELEYLGTMLTEMQRGQQLNHLGYLFKIQSAYFNNNAGVFQQLVGVFLRQYPDSLIAGEVRQLYEQAAFQSARFQAALNSSKSFDRVEPAEVVADTAMLQRAYSFYKNGLYQNAVDLYSEINHFDIFSAKHVFGFAFSLNETGNYSKAGQVLSYLADEQVQPQWKLSVIRIFADYYRAKKNWKRAFSYYKQYLDYCPDEKKRTLIMAPLAEVADKLGDWNTAATFYKRWLQSAGATLDEMQLNTILNRFDTAEDYSQVIEILTILEQKAEIQSKKAEIALQIAHYVEKRDGAEAGAVAMLEVAYRFGANEVVVSKARLEAAEYYLLAGKRELAVRQFEIVADQFSHLEAGKKAAERLVQLSGFNQTIEEEVLQ